MDSPPFPLPVGSPECRVWCFKKVLYPFGQFRSDKSAESTGAKFLIHQSDLDLLDQGGESARQMGREGVTVPAPDGYVQGGDSVGVAGLDLQVIHTPGHTPGSTSIEYQVQDSENSYRALSAGGLGMSMGPVETLTFLSSVERLKALGPWDVMLPNHPWLMPGTLTDIEAGLLARGDGTHPGVLGSAMIDGWFDSVLAVIHEKIEAEAQAP